METQTNRNGQATGVSRTALVRDQAARQMRWRLRRLRPTLRRPIEAWRHAGLDSRDAVLASYPRSGSRWLEMMLGELLVGHEIDFLTHPHPIPFTNVLRRLPDTPRPLPNSGRVIKTHECYRSEYRRAIYLIRHPGDVAISYYRHLSQWALPKMDFERWFAAWIHGYVDGYGSWQTNVESWLRAPVPVELIRFEEFKCHPEEALKGVLRTLGIERDSAAIRRAVENNSLSRMMEKLDSAGHRMVFGDPPPPPEALPDVRGGTAVWRGFLTPKQGKLLKRHAGRAMERCGYEVADLDDLQATGSAPPRPAGSRPAGAGV